MEPHGRQPSPSISLQTLPRADSHLNEGSSFNRDIVPEYSHSRGAAALPTETHQSRDIVRETLLGAPGNENREARHKFGIQARQNHRFGTLLLSILVAAAILLVAGVAFLLFLWLSPPSNHAWRAIVLASWVTRSVTLTALAIRWAAGAQATAAVSMLAAIQLERRGTAFHNAAALSIARFKNAGPVISLPLFFNGFELGKSLLVPLLALLLTCTTLALQFTSTILLGDLKLGPALDKSSTNIAMMAAQNIQLGSGFFGSNYWSTTPNAFQMFAEYTEPPWNGSDGTVDTGVSIRAFLPLSSESARSSIQSYQGTAALFDTRVACLRPESQDISLISGSDPNIGVITSLTITGAVSLEKSMPGTVYPAGGTSFNCSFPLDGKDLSAPAFLICGFSGAPGGRFDVSGGINYDPAGGLISRLDVPNGNTTNHGSGYVVLNYTQLISSGPTPYSNWTLVSSQPRGPWLDLTFTVPDASTPSQIDAYDMAISICFDALPYTSVDSYGGVTQDYNISASSTMNRTEPALELSTTNGQASTQQIQNQLAATKSPNSATRGIMELQINPILGFIDNQRSGRNITTGNPFAVDAGEGPKTFVSGLVWNQFIDYGSNSGRQLLAVACTNCTRNVQGAISFSTGNKILDMNVVQATLFENIMMETGNPSLALQAHLTNLMRMAYYDWVPLFDWNSTQITTMFVDRQVPASRTGLWIVIGFVTAHTILVFTALLWFSRSTKFTLLDNAWQVVSQLHSAETDHLFSDPGVSMATDSQVEKLIQQAGADHLRLRLKRVDGSGRVEIGS